MQTYHFQVQSPDEGGYAIQTPDPRGAKRLMEHKLERLFPNFGEDIASYLWDKAISEGLIERNMLGYTLRLEITCI